METVLQLLQKSIVQKVSKELENHIGIKNETLAEFIIDIKNKSKNIKEFEQNLSNSSAEFDITLIESLWRMIEVMAPSKLKQNKNTKGLKNHTKSKSNIVSTNTSIWKDVNGPLSTTENKQNFPGLAIPNSLPRYIEHDNKQKNKPKHNDKNSDRNRDRHRDRHRHSRRNKKRRYSSRSR
eukprot:766129_1